MRMKVAIRMGKVAAMYLPTAQRMMSLMMVEVPSAGLVGFLVVRGEWERSTSEAIH